MDAGALPRHLRARDRAVLALHQPGLSAHVIRELLERQAVELGLASSAELLGRHRAVAAAGDAVDVPVPRPYGRPVGVLRCTGVDLEDLEELELLAAHAGLALDNAQRTAGLEEREETMRRVAEGLQDALLPGLPTLPGTSLEVRYRAAAKQARVGGDFYDVFVLPGGRALITVGDVVGKGLEAAGRTSRITQTLRALALQGLELHEIVRLADTQVAFQDPDIIATVWCGLYEPATGELRLVSLGHPPALLLRGSGDAIRLELEGLPLGLRDLAPDPPETRSRQLEPRDLLVLYTDGLVESSRDYLAGQEALLQSVRRHRDEPLAAMADGLLRDLLTGAGHLDDAVVLLLRRR